MVANLGTTVSGVSSIRLGTGDHMLSLVGRYFTEPWLTLQESGSLRNGKTWYQPPKGLVAVSNCKAVSSQVAVRILGGQALSGSRVLSSRVSIAGDSTGAGGLLRSEHHCLGSGSQPPRHFELRTKPRFTPSSLDICLLYTTNLWLKGEYMGQQYGGAIVHYDQVG